VSRFGSDKARYALRLELRDFTDALRQCQAQFLLRRFKNGGVVKGIRIPKGGELSRKDLDDMTPYVATFGAKGIAWTRSPRRVGSSLSQVLSATEQKAISKSPEPNR